MIKIRKREKIANKKAELTSKHLVYIVLLVVGFAIVLLLFWQISWTGTVNKEVCHQSVIIRGTLPSFGGAKEYVPLKCKTEKICITTGLIGGRCEDTFWEKESVTKVKVKDIEQIEKFLAQNIIDCWSMMGEGKVLVNTDWIAQEYGYTGISSSCVICSRIAFDKKALEEKGITEEDISDIDVLKYMDTHYISGKEITYLDYIGQSHGAKISIKQPSREEVIEEISKATEGLTEQNEENKKENVEKVLEENILDAGENKDIKSGELAVLFMQIRAPEHLDVLKNTGYALAGSAGASFALAPATTIKAIGALAASWYVVLPVAAIFIAGQQVNVAYNQYVSAGYCGDVSIGDEAKEGCSVVRTLDYNEEELSRYCTFIESIP